MNRQARAVFHDVARLAEDARALTAATPDLAGGRVGVARDGLARALERSAEVCGHLREKPSDGIRVTDEAVREHPYDAIAFSVGTGVILGYLIAHEWSVDCD